MYDLERIKKEYINFITTLVYRVKHGNHYYMINGNEVVDNNDFKSVFAYLNLFAVNEVTELVKGINVDSIDFWDIDYGLLPKNEETRGTKLSVYPVSKTVRTIELANKEKYMRYNNSTTDVKSGRTENHIYISQLYPEGIYAVNDKSIYFVSMDKLKKEYDARIENTIYNKGLTFEEFIDLVMSFKISNISSLFKRLEGENKDEVFSGGLRDYNEAFRSGLREYLFSRGLSVPQTEYDYKPIESEEYDDIMSVLSSIVR